MSYSVFFKDAQENDIVSVGSGLFIGTTTLFTALANVTIGAWGGDPTSTAATYTVSIRRVISLFEEHSSYV